MATHVFKFHYKDAPDWKASIGFTGTAMRIFDRAGHNPVQIARSLEKETSEDAPELLLMYLASLAGLFRERPSSLRLYGASDLQAYGEILVVLEEANKIRNEINAMKTERGSLGVGTIVYDYGDAFLVKTIDRITNTLNHRTGQMRSDHDVPSVRQLTDLFEALGELNGAVDNYAKEVSFYHRDFDTKTLLNRWKKS